MFLSTLYFRKLQRSQNLYAKNWEFGYMIFHFIICEEILKWPDILVQFQWQRVFVSLHFWEMLSVWYLNMLCSEICFLFSTFLVFINCQYLRFSLILFLLISFLNPVLKKQKKIPFYIFVSMSPWGNLKKYMYIIYW